MKKLLIVDDDSAIRGLIRMRLSDTYEIFDTGDPQQGLAMAMQHKPDAVLMDLKMPKFSGSELCQSFRCLGPTSKLPIFVITGEANITDKVRLHILGVTDFFEKPIDFKRLRKRLAVELQTSRPERRAELRIAMRMPLKLRGTDVNGTKFEEVVETENASVNGFLCKSMQDLAEGTMVEVFLSDKRDRYAGQASMIRQNPPSMPWHRYAFCFESKTKDWVLQQS